MPTSDHPLKKRFAWRFTPPGEVAEVSDEDLAPAPEPRPAPPGSPTFAEAADETCEALEAQAEDAWATTDVKLQARKTRQLAASIAEAGFSLVAMKRCPAALGHMMRLLFRHWARLSSDLKEEIYPALAFCPVADAQELDEVVLAAAHTADDRMVFGLSMSLGSEDHLERRHADLGVRLAALVDNPQLSPRVRDHAAMWLSTGVWPDSFPALRRALRTPLLNLRTSALNTLAGAGEGALRDEDLLFLLHDGVVHPPTVDGVDGRERGHRYEQVLIKALGTVRPAGGEVPLLEIAHGNGVYIRNDRLCLSERWATHALAAGYPEHGAAFADEALDGAHRYIYLARTLEHLPWELARPRVLRLGNSGNALDAHDARSLWLKREGTPWPHGPLAGVQADLLTGPPSERMLTRLKVIRGGNHKAAQMLVPLLWSEAPDREALALLLLLLDAPVTLTVVQYPERLEERLPAAFGDAGMDGLLRLAEIRVAASDEVWDALGALAREPATPPAVKERVHQLAVRLFTRGPGNTAKVLMSTGAPEELFPALVEAALQRGDRLHHFSVMNLCEALLRAAPGEARTRAVMDLLRRAVEERRDTACWRTGMHAIPEDLGQARQLLSEAVMNLEDPAFVKPLTTTWHGLLAHAPALRALLRQPGRWGCDVVAGALTRTEALEEREALEALMLSDARGGRAAAQAARALWFANALGRKEPRLRALVERLPPGPRATLLELLVAPESPPPEWVATAVEDALVHASHGDAAHLHDALHTASGDTWRKLLLRAHQRASGEARDALAYLCKLPKDAALYWEDEEEPAGDD